MVALLPGCSEALVRSFDLGNGCAFLRCFTINSRFRIGGILFEMGVDLESD
jgi:hypothetical protein